MNKLSRFFHTIYQWRNVDTITLFTCYDLTPKGMYNRNVLLSMLLNENLKILLRSKIALQRDIVQNVQG